MTIDKTAPNQWRAVQQLRQGVTVLVLAPTAAEAMARAAAAAAVVQRGER